MTTMTSAIEPLSQIRQILGKPYFEAEGILLYHGDCLKLMSTMPPGSVDLTITSPPYNIGKEYEQILPVAVYKEWTKEWTHLLHNITSGHGALWLNLGYVPYPGIGKAVPLPYILWDSIPFYLRQEIVWNYAAGVATKHSFSPRNEKFLWYTKDETEYVFNLDAVRDSNVKYPNQKKNGKLKCNPLGKNPTDVWEIPKVTSGQNRMSPERTPHPAQFPSQLVQRIVLACSDSEGLIFDPFSGSGTTLDVALQNGRAAVAIEVREDYCEIAANRLNNAISERRSRLFELD